MAGTRVCRPKHDCYDGYVVLVGTRWYWAGYNYNEQSSLSPDGRYLLTGDAPDDGGDITRQYLWDLTTGHRRNVTVGLVFAWSADSRWVVGRGIDNTAGDFTRVDTHTGAVATFDPDRLPAPHQGGHTFVNDFPSVAGIDAHGDLILVRAGDQPAHVSAHGLTPGPADVFVVDPATNTIRHQIALPGVIQWSSAPADPADSFGSDAPRNAARPLSEWDGWLLGSELLLETYTDKPNSQSGKSITRYAAFTFPGGTPIATIPAHLRHGRVVGPGIVSGHHVALVVTSSHHNHELDAVTPANGHATPLQRWHDKGLREGPGNNLVGPPGNTELINFPNTD
ncbi:hypothetical protein Athai_38880 [Actinocatenispora thailandica]|uniref:Uncharacterized protein n=1 Tax=Actinocatenispora thailandica TaxID=227318 RepID=A0A7R7DR78_9ACTN|nr:hypothetical protein [Actinocatenispora thailandica]BCJ36385.1 hypothetical protein Athai_38880 [Actinocatenispora thailandica]